MTIAEQRNQLLNLLITGKLTKTNLLLHLDYDGIKIDLSSKERKVIIEAIVCKKLIEKGYFGEETLKKMGSKRIQTLYFTYFKTEESNLYERKYYVNR